MKTHQTIKGSLLTVALSCISIAHAAGIAAQTAKPVAGVPVAAKQTAATPLLQGAKPAVPATTLTAQQIAALLAKAFPKKSMFSCANDFGVMDLNAISQLVKAGKQDLVMNHLNKNVFPCLATPQLAEKNKNLTAMIQKSCTLPAVPTIMVKNADGTVINLSGKLCQPAMRAQDNLAQKKADEALFPGTIANVGCQAAKAAPFDALKLADFVKRNQAIITNPQSTGAQKVDATKNIQKAMGYVNELTVCSKSHKDVNFNKIMTAKFTAYKTCKAPVGFPNANPNFTNMLFGEAGVSLCELSKGTAATIATNQAAAAQKIADQKAVEGAMKALGVPMILGKVNPAGYVGFSESIVKPLALASAPNLIATWFAKDPISFNAHFQKVLANVTAKAGKTTNPKATATVVAACSSTLSSITEPQIIPQICAAANATHAQNGNNGDVAVAKKALAVPMVALQYKTCSEGYGQKLSATMPDGVTPALQKWLELDSKGANGHMNAILGCLNDKAPHPKLSSAVRIACDSGISAIPGTETLCTTATQKDEANTNAMLAKSGVADIATAQAGHDAVVSEEVVTEDPNAVVEDPNALGTDALPADENTMPTDETSSIGDGSDVSFVDPNKIPSMEGTEEFPMDGTEEATA